MGYCLFKTNTEGEVLVEAGASLPYSGRERLWRALLELAQLPTFPLDEFVEVGELSNAESIRVALEEVLQDPPANPPQEVLDWLEDGSGEPFRYSEVFELGAGSSFLARRSQGDFPVLVPRLLNSD